MVANTSYSSDVDGNPPPKKMKMRQTMLQFRWVERTQSSPECHATASSVSSIADQDLRTSECESATASSVSSTAPVNVNLLLFASQTAVGRVEFLSAY